MGKVVFELNTPKGVLKKVQTKNGKFTMRMEWAPGFEDTMKRKFESAQENIDSEVLRLCDPYAPKETGILIRSGIMFTEIGSGKVVYDTPYARRQYYIPMQHTEGRTHMWFEEMKRSGGKEKILNAARRAVKN